jgi:hypothetical protein
VERGRRDLRDRVAHDHRLVLDHGDRRDRPGHGCRDDGRLDDWLALGHRAVGGDEGLLRRLGPERREPIARGDRLPRDDVDAGDRARERRGHGSSGVGDHRRVDHHVVGDGADGHGDLRFDELTRGNGDGVVTGGR